MMGMKRGPIGVWFSVALVLLGLSAWAGAAAGPKIALYWYHHKEQALQKSYSPERARLELELSQMRDIEVSQIYQIGARSDKKIWKPYLSNKIDTLRKSIAQSHTDDIRSVLEFYLGLAYVDAAVLADDDNDKDLAAKEMKSAEALIQSLGWKDHSEETLKVAAQTELDKWNVNQRERRPQK
jgi:hypothetical protein